MAPTSLHKLESCIEKVTSRSILLPRACRSQHVSDVIILQSGHAEDLFLDKIIGCEVAEIH